MPRASRNVRKVRRLKRDRTLAWRLVKIAAAQVQQARNAAITLEAELKRRDEAAKPKDEPALTITKVVEDDEQNHQAD